ncbi:MAG: hypothetical protein Q9P90_14430, partial [candidate division KSB1 bacterium]|nr:hypothetical protein [candidate division KSB1 bacterium]
MKALPKTWRCGCLAVLITILPLTATAQGDFWQQTNGPDGANVLALAIDSINNIFVGTRHGLYRSSEAGEAWQATTLKGFMWDIAVTPAGHLLAATTPGPVMRSRDNGLHWEKASLGMDRTARVSILGIDTQGNIFAASSRGIYRSVDSGDTWSLVSLHLVRQFAFTREDQVYAATDSGMIKSNDNGLSWQSAGLDSFFITAVLINHAGHIFAATMRPERGVFRSTDQGASWQPVNRGLVYGNATPVVSKFAINHQGHIFAAASGVYRTTDNGETWARLTEGLTDFGVSTIIVSPTGQIFAGTQSAGVFRSDDNARSWGQKNTGLLNSTVYSLLIDQNDRIFAGANDGVHVSPDQGQTWVKKSNGLLTFDGRVEQVQVLA